MDTNYKWFFRILKTCHVIIVYKDCLLFYYFISAIYKQGLKFE